MRLAAFGAIALALSAAALIAACPRTGRFDASAEATRLNPTPSSQREKVVLADVKFSSDGSTIRDESKPILDSAAAMLKGKSAKKIYVDSYCEPIGGQQTNIRVSERRAAAVTTYLEYSGIGHDRLTPRGFGATDFVASNQTADGRAQNRRIELVLSD